MASDWDSSINIRASTPPYFNLSWNYRWCASAFLQRTQFVFLHLFSAPHLAFLFSYEKWEEGLEPLESWDGAGEEGGAVNSIVPSMFSVLFVSDQHLWQFWIEMLHNAMILVLLDLLSFHLGPRFPMHAEQLGWQEGNYDAQCLFWLFQGTSGKTLFQNFVGGDIARLEKQQPSWSNRSEVGPNWLGCL